MRIGLLSDTHIPEVAKALPHQLRAAFGGVELILHAGDIYALSVLDELERIAPVKAALGDDDNYDVFFDKRVQEKIILQVEGVKILVMHHGPWFPPPQLKESGDLAGSQEHKITANGKTTADIIVCGHTHRARICESRNGIMIVNPGSATFPRYEARLGTIALLTVSSGNAVARIVELY